MKVKVKLGKQLYRIQTNVIFYFKVMVHKETGLTVPIGPGSGQIEVKGIGGTHPYWDQVILMDIEQFEKAERVDSIPDAFKVLYNV